MGKTVSLYYIPRGESEEVEIVLDTEDFPSGKHHPWPSSRGGTDEMNVDPPLHWAYHVLFANDVIEEIIAKIEHSWDDGHGKIQEEYLVGRIKEDKMGTKYDIRFLAWYTICGKTRSVRKAVKIIRKNFTKRV